MERYINDRCIGESLHTNGCRSEPMRPPRSLEERDAGHRKGQETDKTR